MLRIYVYLSCAVIVFSSALVRADSIGYLQQTSDQYQQTIDVYTDADAAGNHFPARGEFHDSNHTAQVPTMDEISANAACYSGITCITATFNPSADDFGGWYFLNGILTGNEATPVSNWGTVPNAGYDLTGATTLTFWARGQSAGENVHFFAFGVGNTQAPFEPYPDSAPRDPAVGSGGFILTTAWTQYQIDVSGLDLHYILGGFGWVAVASEQLNPSQPITFYIDQIQYNKARPNDPRFLLSYQTSKSTNSFDTVERNAAYIYDNAVALIGLLAVGDLQHARTIADAMIYAQANDRFFTDGRLRNAYQAGDISLPPGWLPNNKPNTVRMTGWYDPSHTSWLEDETQVSSNTGNIAWAMLAVLDFYETTHEPRYLSAVQQLGDWIISNTWDDHGSGGFTGGYDGWESSAAAGNTPNCVTNMFVNGQCKRLYKSTEHNIDLYSAFARLYFADPQSKWAQSAGHAKNFFLSMWDDTDGKFWTGTKDDMSLSTDTIPLDIQAWSLLALGSEAAKYTRSLQYAENHHKTALGYGFKEDGGNSCGDYTWFEGTSQMATAYLFTGNTAKWKSILDGVHSVQLASGAVPATDGDCVNTGFMLNDGQPWLYYPRAHVGATGWLALAERGVNPYRAELYSPPLEEVSLGADGTMWGIDAVGNIFAHNTDGQFWTPVRGQLTQIAVGSGSAVWGLNRSGEIYRWNGQGWDWITGNLQQIAVGSDGDVWGLNISQSVYHFNAAAQRWDQIPGALAQIAVGHDGAVWGLNFAGQIYRYDTGTHLFQQISGWLTQIAVGADGDVWGVNGGNQVYHFSSLTQSWESIPGESLKQIAVGSGANVWGINGAGQVYRFNNQSQSWTAVPGTLSQISAGQNGAAWGVDSSNNVYQLSPPTQATQKWHRIPGALIQVAVAPDGTVWGLNGANQIFTFDPLSQSWTWIPGELVQIAVGANGNVWGINSANQIYTFNSAAQSWTWIPGELVQIAVGTNGNVWGINSANQIYTFNSATESWTWIPGSLRQISVGVDGAVWGTNSADQIYQFNPADQSWTWIPGSLMQVVAGSSSNVCGVNSAGSVYCFDSQTQSWNYLSGVSLKQVAVGLDGTVWGIDPSSQIWHFNSQTQSWVQIPGSLTQIAVGTDAIVWGVNSAGSIYRYW